MSFVLLISAPPPPLLAATCLCMSPEDKSLFVVGGENGGIFKCTLHSRLPDATPFS